MVSQNNRFLRKTSLLLATVAIVLAMMVAPSYAQSVTIASYGWATPDGAPVCLANHENPYFGLYVAMTFNATQNAYITSAKVILYASGRPRGTIGAYITLTNSSGFPTGSAIATSTSLFSMDDISNTTLTNEYTFAFNGSVGLIQYEKYALVLYVKDYTVSNGSHFILVRGLAADAYAGGDCFNIILSHSPLWTNTDDESALGYDWVFQINGISGSFGGGPLTPPGEFNPDSIINGFAAFVVPLTVVLLPALLLILVTRRTDKWLLLIGLTVGTGLGYYFNMVPLWLVFLVTIGLIGMAYQSVRGGNS